MASLLGKADSTLAQMSYREAMADVAPDLKSVYQDEMKTQALFEKGIKDHFDIVYADANKLGDELKEATQTLAANLGTDTKAMELFNDELNRLRDKSKTFPKGKKGDFERAKLRGTLTKLKESTGGMVQTMYNVKEVVDSDTYNIRATYGDKKKFELLKDIASGSAVMGIDNGEVFWSATGAEGEFKMNRHELAKALVLTDPAVQKATLSTTTTFGAATSEDQKFDFDGALNAYENGFTTKEGLADSMHTKQGSLPYTFHEYLTKGDGAEQLYATLKGMGGFDVSGKDGKPDGRVDRHDFSTGANGIKLAESFDLGGDGYDFQKIRKIVSGFYAEKLAGVDFAENQRLLREKNRTPEQTVITDDSGFPLAEDIFGGARNKSGTWIGKSEQIRIYDDVSNKKQEIYGADGSFYVLRGDGKGYMKFSTEANTPSAGEEFYRSLIKEKKGLVGEDKGTAISFEQVLRNNAAYSSKLAPISTEVKSR